MSKNRVLVVGVVVVVLVIVGQMIVQQELAQRKFERGFRLLDHRVELSRDLRRYLDLPLHVATKEDALKYLLGGAAEARPEEYAGAYLLLGRHFLSLDCGQAEYFLRLYERTRSADDSDADRLLSAVRERGCQSALELLGSDPSG